MRGRRVLMSLTVAIVVGGAVTHLGQGASAQVATAVPPAGEPVPVDLVICLDTSNSMDGLIESAKQKLWAVVNDLASADPTPDLRVGLVQYGNDGLSSETGWTQMMLDLTVDLDEVNKQFFALTTNGGTEFVARAITVARERMSWSPAPGALKIIFVSGNEPATQDTEITTEAACKAAIAQDIVVNSIFCGDMAEGINTGWQDVAKLADGEYASIDQNSGTVVVATPVDGQIVELGVALNETYLGYGARAEAAAANQAAQDANAAAAGAPVAAGRATAKAGALYRNAAWDLVDASKAEDFDLTAVPEEQLPEAMQKMTPEERVKYIQDMAAKRTEIQTKIADLGQQRDEYIRQQVEAQGLDESSALDHALRLAIRKQGQSKGINFVEEPPAPAPEPGGEAAEPAPPGK